MLTNILLVQLTVAHGLSIPCKTYSGKKVVKFVILNMLILTTADPNFKTTKTYFFPVTFGDTKISFSFLLLPRYRTFSLMLHP